MRTLLLFLLCALSADAATYYVRQGATGNGSGSDWANALSAVPRIDFRDTYWVADGQYPGFQIYAAVAGTTQVIVKKATQADHGTDTGWQASFGDGTATFTSGCYIGTSYITIDGVTGGGPNNWFGPYGFKWMMNQNPPAGPAFGHASGSTANNVTLKHVEIQGNGGEGNVKNSSPNDGLGIGGGTANWYVGYMWIHDMGRTGMVCDFIDSIVEFIAMGSGEVTSAEHSTPFVFSRCQCPPNNQGFINITVRYSFIHWHRGTGVIAGDGTGLYVYGNVFVDTGNPAHTEEVNNGYITTWGTGGSPANGYKILNAKIYNNSFINLPTSGTPGNYQDTRLVNLQYQFATVGNEFVNNVVYRTYPDMGGVQTVSHNHYVEPISLVGGVPSQINWATVPAQSNVSTNTGNPFVGYTHPTLNFGLLEAKLPPAGVSLPAPYNTDWFGNVRGADGVWDRGAVEFTGVATAPRIESSTNATAINMAPFSYQILAPGATSYGATNLPSGLSVNTTNGIISGTPGTLPAMFVVGMLATNSAGHAHTNLFLDLVAATAVLSVTVTNSNWGEIGDGTTKDFYFAVTNAGGAGTTLTGHATNASTYWSIQGEDSYSLASGEGTLIQVRYAPTEIGIHVGSVEFTGGAGLTNAIQGAAGPMLTVGVAHSATNVLYVAPFTITNGFLRQPVDSQNSIPNSGRAVFFFTLAEDADVTFDVSIVATNFANDSLRVNVDAEPVDPDMIWDIVLTPDTPTTRRVGWRGGGAPYSDGAPDFPTNTWHLMAGTHKLVILGREALVRLYSVTVNGPAEEMGAAPNAATNPTPGHEATGVPEVSVLLWEPGQNTDGYRIWFGTNVTPNILVSTQTASTFSPGGMEYLTPYYWRVDATNSFAVSTGAVWSFTTRAPVPASGEVRAVKQARNPSLLLVP